MHKTLLSGVDALVKFRGETGQVQLLTVFLFLLLIPTTAIIAQNATLEGMVSSNLSGNALDGPQQSDPCAGVVCKDSTRICPDGYQVNCSNFCNTDTGLCSGCVPSCENHEILNLCENAMCPDSEITCSDNTSTSCQNECDPLTGNCSECEPGCVGHEMNITCEENWNCTEWGPCVNNQQIRTCVDLNSCNTSSSKPPENQKCAGCDLACKNCETLNLTDCVCNPITLCIPDDGCCPIGCNHTTDTDCEQPEELQQCLADADCDDNDTCTRDTCSENYECYNTPIIPCCSNDVCEANESYINCPFDCEQEIPESLQHVLDVGIISPNKITRGEAFEINAYTRNIGSASAKNVSIEWVLPEGFYISTGSGSVDCQELAPETSCWNNVTATVPLSSKMGLNDIGVRVSYDG